MGFQAWLAAVRRPGFVARTDGNFAPPVPAYGVKTATNTSSPTTEQQTEPHDAGSVWLEELFAARPVSHTRYHITTSRWGELLHTITDDEAARGAYELPDEYSPQIVDLMASRGLRTAMERARQILAAHGEQVGSDGDAVWEIIQSRQPVLIHPFTPEDLGGLAMPAMRDILRAHPDLQPERHRRR